MNQPARPGPPPARRGAFEPDQGKPEPRPLPRAPADEAAPISIGQIIVAGLLILCGIVVVGIFALGLPLAVIGGNAVLVVPLFALFFLMRGGRRR
jgi:hypothetical protein